MTGLVAGVLTGIIFFLIHLFLFGTGIVKINPNWSLKKLKRHAELLMVIWLASIPVYVFLYRMLDNYEVLTLINKTEGFQVFYYLILFIMFFFIYLIFYYVVDRSVSTRIMLEIDASPEKRLTFEEIKAVYDLNTKYLNELQGMINGGFIKKDGEYYFNAPKGTIIARATIWYKKVFRLGKGG